MLLPNYLCAQPGDPVAQVAPSVKTLSVSRDNPEGLISLDVIVTDGNGNPVPGLTESDFRLFENGREQKILSFQAFTGQGAGAEPPVKVILLIDTLDVSPKLAAMERSAVTYYLRENHGRLGRPTSVFLLAEDGLWTVAKSSNDGNTLAREIDHGRFTLVHRNARGSEGTASPSAIVDPIEYALRALGQIATDERRRPGRKLLIWVGPGSGIGTGGMEKFGSRGLSIHSNLFGTVLWFSSLLREAHVALYSFSVGESDSDLYAELYKDNLAGVTSHSAGIMNLDRKVLAVQSGGRAIGPGVDIVVEIQKCVREAGRFYRISFDPFAAEHPDEYHDLKMEVDHQGLNARTSTGFYDQPYFSTGQYPPLKQVSLKELGEILELDESDTTKANQLGGLELTSRLSESRLASLYALAQGKRTREQLRLLADASSFLDPPADEILAAPPPSPDEQQRIISMASSYLTSTINKLPDFFARRITTRYQETAANIEADIGYKPLHKTDSSTTTVRYRHGREDSDAKSHGLRKGRPELVTYGVFGPALQDLLDAIKIKDQLTWVRWEKEASRTAVFRFTIPSNRSRRYVSVCCLPDGDGKQLYERYAGYHIEVAVDPDSGAILRLSFQFDLKSTTPVARSGIMIEYGPVEIGGKAYYCPLRSISIQRSRSVLVLSEWDESFRSYGPYATMLNDISFDRYHMFRSESHILTGFTPSDK